MLHEPYVAPSPALRMAVLLSTNWTCVACSTHTRECQADHFRPRHAGGVFIVENLAPLCPECNAVKSCYWPTHGYHPLPRHYDLERAMRIHDIEAAWLDQRYGSFEMTRKVWAV